MSVTRKIRIKQEPKRKDLDWTPFTFATTECVYCGADGTQAEHVLPRSRGGMWTVPSCSGCNYSKGARTPEEWIVALLLRAVKVRSGWYKPSEPPPPPRSWMEPEHQLRMQERHQQWEVTEKEKTSVDRLRKIMRRLPRLIASGIISADTLVDAARNRAGALGEATNKVAEKANERVRQTRAECAHLKDLREYAEDLTENMP